LKFQNAEDTDYTGIRVGGGGGTQELEHEILKINYGRDCRREIKRGTSGEGEKERHKRQIKGDTQIAGDREILSKTEDINTCGKKGTVYTKHEYTLWDRKGNR
jgi:hypothetical protein